MKKITAFALALIMALTLAACKGDTDMPNGGDAQLLAAAYTNRADVPEKYKWNLADIYKSIDDYNADAARLTDELIPLLESFSGTLDNREAVLGCLGAYYKADETAEKLYHYANLGFNLDRGDAEAQTLYGKSALLYTQLVEAGSFIIPELSSAEEAVLISYVNDPEFSDYASVIETIIKNKPHTLSEEESRLMAMAALVFGAPENIYTMLTNADIDYGSVTDPSGNEIAVTLGGSLPLLLDPDRDFREAVIESIIAPYKNLSNTFAEILSAEVNKNIFIARAYNYNSALEAAISPDIPVSVYENLLASANKGLPARHEYYRIIKEALGLDTLCKHDLSLPLLPETENIFSYEDAKSIVQNALEPLGEDYGGTLMTAFNENWIDVYETPNKQSGGFSANVYGAHPYILLNYSGVWFDVSTIAHELGHAVHQYYSSGTQPYPSADITIFTTEVASSVNTIILNKYMIDNAKTNAEKLFYINELLDLFDAAFFAQVMYAEFEKMIHETVEGGGTLNAEILNNMWKDLTIRGYGESYTISESDAYRWSRVPHFYYNFYVYQYATSIAAANQAAAWLLSGDGDAFDRYMTFLHSGSRYDSITTLKNLGIDMNSPRVFDVFVDEYASLVAEMERLLREEGVLK